MRFMFKFSSIVALVLAVISGAMLFWVSQQVQEAERTQKKLQAVIEQEEEALRVLSAEWDYLNRPDRLEKLARTYLNMEPMKVESAIQSVNDIPMIETPPAAPIMIGNDTIPQDQTTSPQMIERDEKPATIGINTPQTEPDFKGVLEESVTLKGDNE